MQKEKQYLSLYFPTWSVDLARRRLLLHQKDSLPKIVPSCIILTERISQQIQVKRFCPQAKKLGIREGISLELAKALTLGDLYHEPHDPMRDFEELKKLALWCITFSPCVGLDRELTQAVEKKEFSSVSLLHFGIQINLSGTERLHQDFYKLSERLFALFYKKGLKINLALAPTIGSAWGFSRYGKNFSLTSTQELEAQLKNLPVHALRLDAICISKLEQVGILYIKELLALPRNALRSRFGTFLLCRIDQALGVNFEELRTLPVPMDFFSEKYFEYPLSKKESVVRAIQHIVFLLFEKLNKAGKSAKRFRFIIRSTEDTFLQKDFFLSEGIAELSQYHSIVGPMIDGLTFYEEVFGVAVQALDVHDARALQRDFNGRTHTSDDIFAAEKELLNSLTVTLGKESVTTLELKQSYIPEKAFTYTSVVSPNRLTSQEAITAHDAYLYNILERPSVLYKIPEPIKTIAMLPDKPPSFFQWRGEKYKIITGVGPERISDDWWECLVEKNDSSERDYFRIQDEKGRWLWIFRDKRNYEWFVHGVWG